MRTIRWRNGQCPGRNGQWAERIAHAGSEAVRLVPLFQLASCILDYRRLSFLLCLSMALAAVPRCGTHQEIGAAVFKAQARVILDRIRYCYRGNRAADARRHLQQARWRSRAEHARSHGRPRGRYSLLHRRP